MIIVAFGPLFEYGAVTIWFWITGLIGLVWLKRHIDLARGSSVNPGISYQQTSP